jgi:AraC-like DNA-binding protein
VIPIIDTALEINLPRRSYVEVSDPEEVSAYLESAYGVRLRLSSIGTTTHSGLTHRRIDVGPFAIDQMHICGEVKAEPDPLNKVQVLWATGGHVKGRCEGIEGAAAPGEVTLLSQHDLPHYSHAQDLIMTSVVMDPSIVAGVATGVPRDRAALPIRFLAFRPVNAAAGRLWKETVSYVTNTVLAHEAIATPLVIGQASRMLAAVMLSTFPNDFLIASQTYDLTDHQPVLLRRAISYIESNAGNDIALADIAEAIHVTPRAVQYMFRRHMETTPLQYLRRLRLQHARRDLIAGDPMHNTVTDVAARWGFAHGGRFAGLYRRAYGESPNTTLHN